MEETHLIFKRKRYKLNHFEVKPSKGYYTFDIFFLYFLGKNIGCFSSEKPLRTDKNKRQNYFLVYPPLERKTRKDVFSSDVIGTISFCFDDETKKWNINYITLKTLSEYFITTRKVLIEKKI